MSLLTPGSGDDGRGRGRNDDPLAHLRILTMDQLCELTSYSKQHIYRMMRAGTFPLRRQIGPNRVGVTQADYEAWFASRPVVEPPDDDDASD